MKQVILVSLILNIYVILLTAEVDQVDDSDLIPLLSREQSVVVFFTKSNCKTCDELEAVVENIQSELREDLGAVVVKAHNSQLIRVYSPQGEPSLIYFRKGIPLLYDGELNENEILQMFSENRDPVVKELSDQNFEHLTQASTGATTGDWFVFFYSVDCVLCQRLYAVWETVAAKLRRQTNLARVNRLGPGVLTAKRFGITTSPEFLLFRQGKIYRYKSKEYTIKSFIQFAEEGYRKQTHPENVPAQPGMLDEFLREYVFDIIEKYYFLIGGIAILLLTMACCIVYRCRSKAKTAPKQKAK